MRWLTAAWVKARDLAAAVKLLSSAAVTNVSRWGSCSVLIGRCLVPSLANRYGDMVRLACRGRNWFVKLGAGLPLRRYNNSVAGCRAAPRAAAKRICEQVHGRP